MTTPQPRLFYTNPLAAAWMEEHFGMEIVGLECSGNNIWLELYFTEKLYIYPDSLHLLKPQVGDEGIDADGLQCRYIDDYEPPGWFIAGKPITSFDRARGPVAIDKRNGVAFHWPESEAA